jgi:predicted glycosyltransferase involved in capsule biosynthesis
MASNNNNTSIARDILSSLVEELESLGISINHLPHLNNNGEIYHIALYRLSENLKQGFMHEIKHGEEQGLFVSPGGG